MWNVLFRPLALGDSSLDRRTRTPRRAIAERRRTEPAFQAANTTSDFGAATTLERMAEARRFNQWIAAMLAPALGPRLLDVGSGIAALTKLLAATPGVESVLAIEPAANLYPALEVAVLHDPKIKSRQVTTQTLANEPARFDTVTYVNVLEHIESDVEELRTAHSLLVDGGRIGLLVPAAPWLYGSMDRLSGHYRRYTRSSLQSALTRAGFRVDDVRYVDAASMLPYWLMYRVLHVKHLGGGSGFVFDGILVPLSKLFQRAWPSPPFGKNLVLVGTKI